MKYVFEKTVKVAGVKRSTGEIVPASEIPAGHLDSLLRQGHVSEYVETDAASRFAAAMTAGLPDEAEEALKAAAAEIDRLRQRGAAMAVENKKLRDENAFLTAEFEKLEADVKAAKLAAEKKSAAEPDPTTDEKLAATEPDPKPPEAKAEPPKIGPAKPPELKAGGKK